MIIVVPFMRVAGMALFPFILVKEQTSKNDKVLINHERIHLRQQAELLILQFYVLYLLNYVINLIHYRDHNSAYLNIIFEREAFKNEADLEYPGKRKFFAFLRYF